eukprot:178690_1
MHLCQTKHILEQYFEGNEAGIGAIIYNYTLQLHLMDHVNKNKNILNEMKTIAPDYFAIHTNRIIYSSDTTVQDILCIDGITLFRYEIDDGELLGLPVLLPTNNKHSNQMCCDIKKYFENRLSVIYKDGLNIDTKQVHHHLCEFTVCLCEQWHAITAHFLL